MNAYPSPSSRPSATGYDPGGAHEAVDGTVGHYVVVVADHSTGGLDSYGPMEAAAAARVLVDLRELLREDGIEDVSAVVGRLHGPGAPGHPDDP